MRREGTIDYTDEYNRFMARLETFHQKHGTVLNREPVLGSQRLDLLKVYKLVTAHGGCEKVTAERGWKRITLPFNFPPTCTNSAYVMKSVYVKNLELFEQEDFFGKEVPVNKLEATESNITRSREASQVPSTRRGPYMTAHMKQQLQMQQQQQQQQAVPHQPIPQPMPTAPQAAPAMTVNGSQRPSNFLEGYYVDGGHQNRILLALKSELPNEIDWAFSRLISLSFEWNEFSLNMIPGLLNELLSFAQPFFDWWSTLEPKDIEELMGEDLLNMSDTHNMERVLQVFHILRNLSFLDHNTVILTEHAGFRKMLQQGLSMPSSTQLDELRIYCLDTLECLSIHITLRSKFDVYLRELQKLLHTNDKALILGSLRALTRLAANEHNEKILSDIDPEIIERISQLLLIQDDELIGATLDYLYQFSSFHGDTAVQIAKNFPGNIVAALVRFLSWGSPKALAPPPTTDPAQLILHEPYRALHWLQSNFESNPQAYIYEWELFKCYQTKFLAHGPMLRSADLVTVSRVGFPKMETTFVQETEGAPPVQVIKGIAKKHWVDFSGADDRIICRWIGCQAVVATEAELFKHAVQEHISPGMGLYACQWLSCRRFTTPTHDRHKVIKHLKTHFPLTPTVKPFSNRPRWFDMRPNVLELPNRELAGIPLTAVFILRNLSRQKRNQKLFLPYEESLARIMGEFPRMAAFIVDILTYLRVG
ncbi:Chromatin structure-remodeling complex protein rsc9 [Mortierella polycephala]|uniref:Chromatin structure-remodeling complex protein rsc9 n=1 Tax=Mortierella polycephala TaxID=41804 RepID=A0A9P6TZ63_9FUNG|nr:Chromatin structure-remodeling complex protein rsc9 [Mortierella polycephala]